MIKIRAATVGDAATIAAVRSDAIFNISHSYYDPSLLDEWAGSMEERVQRLLSNAADVRIIAEIDAVIVGYGELVTNENLLGACYVASTAGGKGVGKAIVAELERIAREKGLRHLQMESSANAELFYIGCGYRVVDRGKHPMRSGAVMDCILMRKELQE